MVMLAYPRVDAETAASFLKVMSNKDRLQILSSLMNGEQSVGAIERRLGLRQPALSQQLARLRADELVRTRREGKVIFYSLADDRVVRVMRVMQEMCGLLTELRSDAAGDSAYVSSGRAAAEPS